MQMNELASMGHHCKHKKGGMCKCKCNTLFKGTYNPRSLDLYDHFIAAPPVDAVTSAPTSFPTASPTAEPINQGLLAWYKMDGNAVDSSGNGYDGTLHGGNFASMNGPDGTAAYSTAGGYLSIDGLKNHAMGSQFSVCTWFRRNGGGDYAGIIGVGHQGPGIWWLCQGREIGGTTIGGRISPEYDPSPSWTFGYQSYKPYLTATNSAWHHVCMTWDGTVSNVYLDGALSDTTAASRNTGHNMRGPIAASDDPVMIGHRGRNAPGDGGYADYWNGAVDNVRLYTKAVDESVVQTLYSTHA
jgi:hypothetical protein